MYISNIINFKCADIDHLRYAIIEDSVTLSVPKGLRYAPRIS